MQDKKRLLIYYDDLVMTLAKQYSATMNTRIYSPSDIISSIQGLHPVDAVEVVRCKDCKHWHEETSWCTEHSHFIGFDGMACHPSQSSEWKMFDADDFCSYGERKDNA